MVNGVQFFSLLHPNKGKITFKNGGLKLAFSQIFQFRLGTIDFVGVKVVRVMLFLVAFFFTMIYFPNNLFLVIEKLLKSKSKS